MDEVVEEFLVESYENLDRVDADLLALEEEPGRPDLLASVFRGVHTIKGTCGFLGFAKLEQVTHVGESLLSRLRDRELVLTGEVATALLRMAIVSCSPSCASVAAIVYCAGSARVPLATWVARSADLVWAACTLSRPAESMPAKS